MTIEISAVIATYQRAPLLAGALEALTAQKVPSSLEWEIVVVDNNSCDETADVVRAFSKTAAIPLGYVFEPRQGLSHARNRGIKEARGSIIAFTDDDVLPSPDWIARWGQRFADGTLTGLAAGYFLAGKPRRLNGSRPTGT